MADAPRTPPPRGRRSRRLRPRCGPTASPTSCCWAWADRACVRKSWPSRSGRRPAAPRLHVLDSTDPGAGCGASSAASARHDAGDRRQQVGLDARAQHLQRLLLRPHGRRSRRGAGAAGTSWRSPIRDRSSRPRPGATASGASSPACPRSAAGTRRCRRSASCRPRRWAWTSRAGSAAPATMAAQCARAGCREQSRRRARPGAREPAPGSAWTSSQPSSRRASTIWARGSSSWSPSRLERTATRLSPSTASRSAAARVYGPTACSSTFDSRPRPTTPRMRRSRRWSRPGGPSCGIDVPDVYALAGEFFRWEIATAVAGAVMGINPFDQPDVEASKIETRKLTDDVEKTGHLPAETPVVADGVAAPVHRCLQRGAAVGAGRRRESGRLDSRATRAAEGRRLPGAARVRADDRPARTGSDAHARRRARPAARRHVRRLRAALPALDGPGLQGRTQLRRLPADHLRRRRGSARARRALFLRRREGRAGARRFSGARRPRPPCAARAPRRRRDCGAGDARADRRRGRCAPEPGRDHLGLLSRRTHTCRLDSSVSDAWAPTWRAA